MIALAASCNVYEASKLMFLFASLTCEQELGCHSTIRSFDPAALNLYRAWLQDKYSTIDGLNAAWGNSFWSMTYGYVDSSEMIVSCFTSPPGLTPARVACHGMQVV